MKYNIRIISDKDDPQGGLQIIESDEQGYSLKYREGEVLGETDPRHPIHLSNLKLKLQQRAWNSPLRKHIGNDSEKNLRMRLWNSEEHIDVVSPDSNNESITVSNVSGLGKTEEDNILKKKIISGSELTIKDIADMVESNNIYLYDTSRSIINLLENTVTYNIIDYCSDVYTNTISLNEVSVGLVYPGCKGRVELGIQYSKMGNIYNHDTVFKTLVWGSPTEDFREQVGEDVVIEYANNVIRVIPVSAEVDECIISNCVLTYGSF